MIGRFHGEQQWSADDSREDSEREVEEGDGEETHGCQEEGGALEETPVEKERR